MFDKKEEKLIIDLARQSIEAVYDGKDLEVDPKDLPEKLLESWPVYVTIKQNGEVKGCVGEVETKDSLYLNVIKNARNAAFADMDHEQLSLKEWKEGIDVEVSVLSEPGLLAYLVLDDVYEFMNAHQPGVIIEKGAEKGRLDSKSNRVVFLPDMWEELDEVDDFMGELCKQAGLKEKDWQNRDVRILVFEVIKIG